MAIPVLSFNRSKKLVFGSIAGALLFSIAVFSFFSSGPVGFHIPAVGTFAGNIVWETKGSEPVPLLIHRLPNRPELLVVAGGDFATAETFPLELNGPRTLEPLTLKAGLRLTTDQDKSTAQGYKGTVTRLTDGVSGVWSVNVTELSVSGTWTALSKWGSQFVDAIEAARAAQAEEAKIKSKKAEVAELNRYIVERSDFRDAAKNRLGKTSESLDSARSNLEQLRAQVVPLERELTIASRVTPKGRLVALARETLERESDWVHTMLERIPPEVSKDFERGLAKARRVTELKDQIRAELNAIESIKQQNERALLEREPVVEVPPALVREDPAEEVQ